MTSPPDRSADRPARAERDSARAERDRSTRAERDSARAERDPLSRRDARESTQRDLVRRRRRGPPGRFWQSVGLMGSVGWPIVLLAVAGAWLGRFIDQRYDTGVRFTFMLLALFTTFGTWIAFRTLKGPP